MSGINEQIEQMAENMEKANSTPKDQLIKTIQELGPEGLRAKLPTLEKSEKELLFSVLEDMKKGGPGSGRRGSATRQSSDEIKSSLKQKEAEAKKKYGPSASVRETLGGAVVEVDGKIVEQRGAGGGWSSMKKAVSMDDAYQAKYVEGDIEDTKLQEDKADDDQDEKMMKPAAQHNHQGDTTPEGREGQVIKAEDMTIEEDKKKDKKIAEREAKQEVKQHEKEMHKGMSVDEAIKQIMTDKKQVQDVLPNVEESKRDDVLAKLREMKKMKKSEEETEDDLEKGLKKKQGVPTGVDPEKHERCVKDVKKQGHDKESAIRICNASMKKSEQEVKEALGELKKAVEAELGEEATPELVKSKMKEALEKADSMIKTRKGAETDMDGAGQQKKINKEEDQLSDTDEMTEGKTRAKKEKLAEEAGKDNKKNMTKSVDWADQNRMFKSDFGGRNHSFSVNKYYDEAIKKAEKQPEEDLKKSEDGEKKEDLNDIIEKGGDASWDEVTTERMIKSNTEKVSGKFQKSFEDNEIAQALGLTEEEAKKILGE